LREFKKKNHLPTVRRGASSVNDLNFGVFSSDVVSDRSQRPGALYRVGRASSKRTPRRMIKKSMEEHEGADAESR